MNLGLTFQNKILKKRIIDGMKWFDNFLSSIAWLGAIFGGGWIVSIILYGEVPDYVKYACIIFLTSIIILFYYDKIKEKPSPK